MDLRLKDKKVSNDSRWEQRGVELPGGSAESIALSLLSRSVFIYIYLFISSSFLILTFIFSLLSPLTSVQGWLGKTSPSRSADLAGQQR